MTIHGVPQNLLNVTGTDYVVVNDYQESIPVTEIDGKPNIIDLLYTEEGIDQYPAYPSTDISEYDVAKDIKELEVSTNTIKFILPTGVEQGLNAKAGETIIYAKKIRATPRAYCSKFPFNIFSGFSRIALMPTVLTSIDDFMSIVYMYIWNQDYAYQAWLYNTKTARNFNWTDDVPKGFLHVHLNPDISEFDR